MSFDLLEASLLDLLHELREADIRLILGGGYGLYLKQRRLRRSEERTLLSAFPEARSTNDLDLFLRTEIVADPRRMGMIANVLARLGCEPVESAKYLQFVRRIPAGGTFRQVKFDFLTGPAHPDVDLRLIRTDSRRPFSISPTGCQRPSLAGMLGWDCCCRRHPRSPEGLLARRFRARRSARRCLPAPRAGKRIRAPGSPDWTIHRAITGVPTRIGSPDI